MLFAKLNNSKVGGIPEIFTISELIEKGVVDKGFNQYAKLSSIR